MGVEVFHVNQWTRES